LVEYFNPKDDLVTFPRIFAAALLGAVTALAQAQSYPSKVVGFVVPFAAGSATDQLARALGQEVSNEAKQPVIVDNKAGANGFIAAQFVAKAAPDGHTVFITTNTTQSANEHLFKKLPYDPVKDFAPVAALGRGGNILIVRPDQHDVHRHGNRLASGERRQGPRPRSDEQEALTACA